MAIVIVSFGQFFLHSLRNKEFRISDIAQNFFFNVPELICCQHLAAPFGQLLQVSFYLEEVLIGESVYILVEEHIVFVMKREIN